MTRHPIPIIIWHWDMTAVMYKRSEKAPGRSRGLFAVAYKKSGEIKQPEQSCER